MDHHLNHFNESLLKEGNECEKIEPGELLEEGWFFGNLLERRKSRMSRSLSDPSTSSSDYGQEDLPEKSYEETYASIKKMPGHEEFNSIVRAPSIPPSIEGKDQSRSIEGSSDHHNHNRRRSKSKRRKSSNGLNRAPSLPTSLGTEEFQDEEIEFSMGKLIRQASMKNPDPLPPRTHASSKGATTSNSSNIYIHRSRKKPDSESLKLEGIRPQYPPSNQLKTQKSLNDLEYEELQGFKDLGFDFDEEDLNPKVISIIPGLQEKKEMEEDEDKNVRRPYLSEAWKAQISAPPVPKWGGKRSTEDMKAQIKFWARAVASNVRQEC